MADKGIAVVIWVAGFALIALISYLFSMIGEPRAVWLWCDIMGICHG